MQKSSYNDGVVAAHHPLAGGLTVSAAPLVDLSRLCLHTITTRPWPIETAIQRYAAAGVRGVTVWRQWLQGRDIPLVGRQLGDAGLRVVSLCRGGFFPAADPAGRRAAIDENLRAIDEARGLGAPLIVLVCGAVPGQPLEVSRGQIADAVAAVADRAAQAGVRLAVEPLHPMYADARSAINTLRQANDLCDRLASPQVGVAVDVYHVWWDGELRAEIQRCGRSGRLWAFHVCDWRTPTEDLLNDRGLMGEGCIPLRQIRGWIEEAGFDGMIEVEIFSNRFWAMDQDAFLDKIKGAYLAHV
ncbi:MAG: sugar phosphate isomerase/epimerase family protein [Thermoguttaceae bacterium]